MTHPSAPEVITPEVFDNIPGVLSALSTRLGGVSPPPFGMNTSFRVGDDEELVRDNRALFFGKFGIGEDRLAIPGQRHGSRVVPVSRPGSYPDCDALVTNADCVFLCISFADCIPVFLADPVTRTVAAAHAGWRGAAGTVVGGTIAVMKERFGVEPGNLRVYLGPGAGQCCYSVGPEVAGLFEPSFLRSDRDNVFLDLKAVLVRQLEEAGVPRAGIEVNPSCTICGAGRFHSFRRDKDRSGRMMGFIGLSGGMKPH